MACSLDVMIQAKVSNMETVLCEKLKAIEEELEVTQANLEEMKLEAALKNMKLQNRDAAIKSGDQTSLHLKVPKQHGGVVRVSQCPPYNSLPRMLSGIMGRSEVLLCTRSGCRNVGMRSQPLLSFSDVVRWVWSS